MLYIQPKVTEILVRRNEKYFKIKNYDDLLTKCTVGDNVEIIHKHFKTILPIKNEDDLSILHSSITFNTLKYRIDYNGGYYVTITPIYPMPLFYRGEVCYLKTLDKDVLCHV